ncbi:MAG: type II toxin-antitoxin system Phd/YefM family antitoxin [candidate division KSB1 bacterium]|nr:type II toxin-antitoxin system Phd/YefM family antitoxin [candidate division KSB1 bacterium]MDQ7063338.1 type II toxin-antitoxin system Phd/YefM family antitoxin [candidate division KSB1 bacterium]
MDATFVELADLDKELKNIIEKITSGEKIIILKGGKPVAEIKPISEKAKKTRPFGLCKGEFVVPDDFDEPLPELILNEFEGKD